MALPHDPKRYAKPLWIPAFAGMTKDSWTRRDTNLVIPAKAGIQGSKARRLWIAVNASTKVSPQPRISGTISVGAGASRPMLFEKCRMIHSRRR